MLALGGNNMEIAWSLGCGTFAQGKQVAPFSEPLLFSKGAALSLSDQGVYGWFEIVRGVAEQSQ